MQNPNTSQFPSPPPSISGPASASSVYEYVMSFEKPLTRDEKTVWLMVIVYYVQNGLLPESIYPTLCNKIAALPEVLPAQNRPEEKIPGSDYIHPGPPKPYQVLLKMYDGNKPVYSSDTSKITPFQKYRGDTISFILGIIAVSLILVFGFIAYGVNPWRTGDAADPITISNTHEAEAVSHDPGVSRSTKVASGNPFVEHKPRGPVFGPELLPVSDFRTGFLPDQKTVFWHNLQGGRFKLSNDGSSLKIDATQTPEGSRGVLEYRKIELKKGRRYYFYTEARCHDKSGFTAKIQNLAYESIGMETIFYTNDEWKIHGDAFTATEDVNDAMLHVCRFLLGRIYEIRRVSLREIISEPEKRHENELLFIDYFDDVTFHVKNCHFLAPTSIATMRMRDGILQLKYTAKSNAAHIPQLRFMHYKFVKEKKYKVLIEMRSDKKSNVTLKAVERFAKAFNEIGFKEVGFSEKLMLSNEWKTFTFDFSVAEDTNDTRLSLESFNEFGTYEIRKVSLEVVP